jgi:hypothetical protein
MLTRPAVRRSLLPILAISVLLLFAFLVSSRGNFPFNGKLVACVGYGSGYGYTGGPPSVTGINPTAGPIAGGTTVAITGVGFCGFTGATAAFGGVAATSFIVNSETSATAVSPAHVFGAVDVTVTNEAGTSATSAADLFTYSAFTRYFQWYDKASTGFLNDNIHLVNASGSTAHVQVSLPGATPISVTVDNGVSTYVNFPQGTIGGPVSVNSDFAILSSQRVQYNQSFNEVWSESAAQADTTSYINWFDNASTGFLNDNIHLLNPGTTTATVAVSLTGVPSAGTKNVSVGPGAETYVSFATGTIGGPVKIVSSSPILASQRVQFNSTFNEVWAEPATMSANSNLVTWFDMASTGFLNDNIHLINPTTGTATVHVSTPNAATLTTTVGAGLEMYVHFPKGTIGGPVTVASDVAILSSQRVQYHQSFNEVWAETIGQATPISHTAWYDKASTGFHNVNIHLINPGSTAASVSVSVPNAATQTATVPAGGETYVTFAQGTIGGPVTVNVTSGPAVVASERVQFYDTFNEIWTSQCAGCS